MHRELILTTELHQHHLSCSFADMLSLITLFLPSEHDRFVAVVAVIVDDIVAGRVGKTLPSGNMGNQDLYSSSSFIFTTDSSWILAKKLFTFYTPPGLESYSKCLHNGTLRNMIALDVLFVVD